jgi:VIT1/CCC1 family predicted Fe2+/Mn2+ transporter
VVFDRKFWREISESVALMLGTALATYLLGTAVGKIFHTSERSL